MMETLQNLIPLTMVWPAALLLLPLPWLLPKKKTPGQPSYLAPHLPMFDTVKALDLHQTQTQNPESKWISWLLSLSWIFLILALARPTYIGEKVDLPLSGRDLMLAIDISPSMKETDLKLDNEYVTRLDVVKDVVSKFVVQRQGDRIGLILFGSEPYIQSPLSFDTKTVNTLLNEAYLGMAGKATAIGDAIGLGVKRLRERPKDSRVLILLSDGANTAGEIPPEKAAQLAAQENIVIYTIGIGADELYRRSFFGTQKLNPSADLDEAMLKLIASSTKGQYFRARNTQELGAIYELINSLEPIELETKSYRPTRSLFSYFLGFAMLLYTLTLLFSNDKLMLIFERFGLWLTKKPRHSARAQSNGRES